MVSFILKRRPGPPASFNLTKIFFPDRVVERDEGGTGVPYPSAFFAKSGIRCHVSEIPIYGLSTAHLVLRFQQQL